MQRAISGSGLIVAFSARCADLCHSCAIHRSADLATQATSVAEAVGTITGRCGMAQASASTTISDQ